MKYVTKFGKTAQIRAFHWAFRRKPHSLQLLHQNQIFLSYQKSCLIKRFVAVPVEAPDATIQKQSVVSLKIVACEVFHQPAQEYYNDIKQEYDG